MLFSSFIFQKRIRYSCFRKYFFVRTTVSVKYLLSQYTCFIARIYFFYLCQMFLNLFLCTIREQRLYIISLIINIFSFHNVSNCYCASGYMQILLYRKTVLILQKYQNIFNGYIFT